MSKVTSKRTARRGRIFPEVNFSPEEIARRQAELDSFYQRCRPIFDRVQPELIQDHYNWFMVIEPDSGDYFIDPDQETAAQKARQKHPNQELGMFRLNKTGACGRI